jgi:hypothetical protein
VRFDLRPEFDHLVKNRDDLRELVDVVILDPRKSPDLVEVLVR